MLGCSSMPSKEAVLTMKTLPSFLSLFSWSLARSTSSMSAFSRSSMTLRFPAASTLHHYSNSISDNNASSVTSVIATVTHNITLMMITTTRIVMLML